MERKFTSKLQNRREFIRQTACAALGTAALTATIGTTMDFDCYGKYVIQPGSTFLIAGMSSTGATGKLVIGVRWHEVVLDLG